MSKKLKILLFLSVIALVLFFYLLFTSEFFKEETGKNREQIAVDYKISATRIVNNYSQLETVTVSEVKSTKDNLLVLKVPAELKDLHVELIMAITRMEDYLNNGNEEDLAESKKIINKAKMDYSWLAE
jgi:hypothetical protein